MIYCNICRKQFQTDDEHRQFLKTTLGAFSLQEHGYSWLEQNRRFVDARLVVPEHLFIVPNYTEAIHMSSPAFELYSILRKVRREFWLEQRGPTYLPKEDVESVRSWFTTICEDPEAASVFTFMLESLGGYAQVSQMLPLQKELLDRVADLFDLPRFWEQP